MWPVIKSLPSLSSMKTGICVATGLLASSHPAIKANGCLWMKSKTTCWSFSLKYGRLYIVNEIYLSVMNVYKIRIFFISIILISSILTHAQQTPQHDEGMDILLLVIAGIGIAAM